MEKKDSEMESGIESDQDDDRGSLNDATRAAAAGGGRHVGEQTSSIDALIESLMVPPPPSSTSSTVNMDELTDLIQTMRAPSPSPTTATFQRSAATPPCRSDDSFSDLIIPPPPTSLVNDADLEAFLAKIVACNGVVGSETMDAVAVNGLSVAGSRYVGRQMSDSTSIQRSSHAVNTAALHPRDVDDDELPTYVRCAGTMNNVQGGYIDQSTTSRSVCKTASGLHASYNDERLSSRQRSGVVEVPSAVQAALCNYRHVSRTSDTQRLQIECMLPDSATSVQSPMSARRVDIGNGGTLTRSTARRRPPPPPPPRKSSVQNSPALSCRSEQLTRRGLPRHGLVAGLDRLTPLPTPPSPVRSALIRPAALRSSFTATSQPDTTISVIPPSPDWTYRRSHSLTESATAHPGGKPSLLAVIGSRLRSYWSPSAPRVRRERPATATGGQRDYRRRQLNMPSRNDVDSLLRDDDDTDNTYLSFDIDLTSRQLRMSPTMSSFSSFTGE